jgi:NADH:ubiquinone oxidoreductase subunit 5 (subunit L)/multisubunit Na+/H+ antiporter MnhA subunit
MAAPAALLTSLLLLLLLFWLGGEARSLAPWKVFLWTRYGGVLFLMGAALLVNLAALSLILVRALGLKRTGRKLAHVDQELRTDSAIGAELVRLENPGRQE